ERSVVMSSLIPSLKYSCSESPLILANGNTQTDTSCRAGRGPSVLRSEGPMIAATLAVSLRQPAASCSPFQPDRSAHWIWLNGIGGMLPSSVAWTSLLLDRPASASALTHCDLADSADHNTTTALACLSRSSMTSE